MKGRTLPVSKRKTVCEMQKVVALSELVLLRLELPAGSICSSKLEPCFKPAFSTTIKF